MTVVEFIFECKFVARQQPKFFQVVTTMTEPARSAMGSYYEEIEDASSVVCDWAMRPRVQNIGNRFSHDRDTRKGSMLAMPSSRRLGSLDY